MKFPVESREDSLLHVFNVAGTELTSAQVRQSAHLNLLLVVKFDGDVQRSEGCQEREVSVTLIAPSGKITVKEVETDRDDFAR